MSSTLSTEYAKTLLSCDRRCNGEHSALQHIPSVFLLEQACLNQDCTAGVLGTLQEGWRPMYQESLQQLLLNRMGGEGPHCSARNTTVEYCSACSTFDSGPLHETAVECNWARQSLSLQGNGSRASCSVAQHSSSRHSKELHCNSRHLHSTTIIRTA